MNKNIKILLDKAITDAISKKNSNTYIELDTIDNKTASIIYELTGVNVQNRKQIIYYNDIRHMINAHSNKELEKEKNQKPIKRIDIIRIPIVLKKYNYIKIGTYNREGKSIKYIKKYSNNQLTIIEVIPKKSSLKIKTMWKTALDDTKAPSKRPKRKQ